jgi:DNA-binding response OmpR family regulator
VSQTLLLIEDDARIRQALSLALGDEGYDVVQAATGERGLQYLDSSREPIDLILLDLMLPGMDGLEVCRRIRERGDLPVIIVTARTDSPDVVAGLEAGADDYVTKPLVASELTARIRALMRRTQTVTPGSAVTVGDVTLDPGRGTASRNSESLHLTKTEFRLLCELAAAGGRIVSREQLLERVWDYGYFADTRLLDVHIRRLRRKIEPDPSHPSHILTVRGLGYRLAS